MTYVRTVLYGWVQRFWEPPLGLALMFGVGVRLVLIPWFSDPFNFWGSYLTTDLLAHGANPLAVFAMDPRFRQLNPWGYPALYFFFTLLGYVSGLGSPYIYTIWLRIPLVFFDAGTSILLFRTTRVLGGTDRQARIAALAFLFNPFSVLVTSVWGENDPIPVFFTALAVYMFLQRTDRAQIWGAWAVGLGVVSKIYPALILPVLLALVPGLWKKLRLVVVAAIPPVLASVPFFFSDLSTYLGTLLGFAGGISGRNANLLDPQFTLMAILSGVVGPLDARVAYVLAAGLLLVLLAIYVLVRFARLDVISAGGLALIAAYLLAVRWSPNYLLWIVPSGILLAVLRLQGWRRWVLLGFWLPAVASTLIYNGWYQDAFSGATGMSYWGLISGAPEVRFDAWFSTSIKWYLVGALYAMMLLACLLILRPNFLGRRAEASARPTEVDPPRQSIASESVRRHTVLVVVALVSLAVFAGSLAYQTIHAQAVNPTDFASFQTNPTGTYSMADDFRARILSFRWVFGGSGRYSLHPNGTSGILLDTVNATGNAYIENSVSAQSLTTVLVLRIVTVYGTGPLILLREGGTWVGVLSTALAQRWLVIAFSEQLGRSFAGGLVGTEWFQISLYTDKERETVSALGATFDLPSTFPIESVQIGQRNPNVGGGAFVVGRVSFSWSSGSIPPAISAQAVAGLDVLAMFAPFLVPVKRPMGPRERLRVLRR